MSAQAAVHDALAAKLGSLAAIKNVYGDGSTNAAVSPSPYRVVTMPAVLVRHGQDERTMGLQRELWITQWEADFYLPLSGQPGLAVKRVNEIRDQLRVEMRLGVSLEGLVSVCRYLGTNAPVERQEGDDDARTIYLVLTARFETQERLGVSVTI